MKAPIFKGIVMYYNPTTDKVEEMKIEAELTWDVDDVGKIYFWAISKCPFDNSPLTFDIVYEGEIDKELLKVIKNAELVEKEFTNLTTISEYIDTLLNYYDEPPSETGPADNCIHFNPREYLEDAEDRDDYIDLLEVEEGIIYVDVNDILKALVDYLIEDLKNDLRISKREDLLKKLEGNTTIEIE